MLAISTLGYAPAYAVALLLLGFGVRMRPTLGVMLAVLLTGEATDPVKSGFQQPRPFGVDGAVLKSTEVHVPLVAHGGATHFFGLPSAEVHAATRALPETDDPAATTWSPS